MHVLMQSWPADGKRNKVFTYNRIKCMSNNSKTKKRILMILPTLRGGGAERVVSNLTLGLADMYDIDILLDYNATGYPYKGNLMMLASQCAEPRGIRKFCLYLKKIVLLRKMKKERRYDSYISHSRISNITNVLSGYRNQNVITAMHGSITRPAPKHLAETIIKRLEKYALQRAPKVIAVSQGVADELVNLLGVKKEHIVSIWNGSDIERIQKLAGCELNEEAERWFRDGQYTICTMGRYVIEKGHWHLIRAFSRVVGDYPNVKLIVLGDGKLRGYYEKLILGLGLQERVVLTGFQDNPFSVIAHSNLFVFSSISEGFPCSLAEAICCGVPCVSTDFRNGAREIMGYGMHKPPLRQRYEVLEYGILTPVCSGTMYQAGEELEEQERILADSIMYIFKNRDRAAKFVANNAARLYKFSVKEMVSQWHMVIER